MLALVTCHIFPPQSDTEKNEFLAPDFPADSSQFFRVHGFTSAVRQMPTAMRNPFAWTNVSSGKKPVLQFGHTLERNSSICPIISYLWMVEIFFLWGQPLKIIHKNSAKKKVQPLGILFWHLRLGLFKSPFFGWWSWTYVVVPLLQGQMYFQKKKTPVLQFGRVDTKFLNSSHHVYLWMIGLEMRLFSCGANLWRSSASIQSKKVQPLGFYFWPLRLGLLKSLFWLKVNICVCTLLQSHVKNHTPSINHGTFFSWGLTFRYVLVNSHLIHPPSNSWLLTLGILQTYPLSESFMIDFLMPYIHRLIDQSPPITTDRNWFPVTVRQEAFRKKILGLFWYDILFLAPCHAPGPSPTVC